MTLKNSKDRIGIKGHSPYAPVRLKSQIAKSEYKEIKTM